MSSQMMSLAAALPNLWWKIDLLAVYKVRAITVINPGSKFMEIEIFIKMLDSDGDKNM